jgi:hypothetical protein
MTNLERDLRRLQLLDELRGRLIAFEYEPQLDPTGSRSREILALIQHLQDEQLAELHS